MQKIYFESSHYYHPRLTSICRKLHGRATTEAANLRKRELAKEIYNNSNILFPEQTLPLEQGT